MVELVVTIKNEETYSPEVVRLTRALIHTHYTLCLHKVALSALYAQIAQINPKVKTLRPSPALPTSFFQFNEAHIEGYLNRMASDMFPGMGVSVALQLVESGPPTDQQP